MSALPRFIFLRFIIALSKDCDHYDEGPIRLALNQISGTIQMSETLDISFDLQIHTECLGWCHILAIGARYPLLYTHSRAFYSEFLQYPIANQNNTHVDAITDIYTSMIDGSYHHFHLKYTPTQRTITFDDISYTDRSDVNNNIQHRYFDISTVWGTDIQYATNATIKHLCINPRFTIIETQMSPQVLNTQSKAIPNTEDYEGSVIILVVVVVVPIFVILMIIFGYYYFKTKKNKMNDAEDEGEVKQWLFMIGLEQYYDVFMRNGLCSLEFISKIRNEKDLESIGIDLKGHRIIIMSEIENLKSLIEVENDEGINGANVEGNTVTESNINMLHITVKDDSDTEQ